MQVKNTLGAILIYIGSGLIFGKCYWVGLPFAIIGAILIGYVNAQIGLKK